MAESKKSGPERGRKSHEANERPTSADAALHGDAGDNSLPSGKASGNQPPRPVVAVKLQMSGIPKSLKLFNRWILWKFTLLPNGKWSKTPHSPSSGHKIDATNLANGASFETAVQALRKNKTKFDGLGFLLGDGLAGVDVDDCIDPVTGEMNERGKTLSDKLLSTYAEVSPSGTGFKAIVDIGDDPRLAVVGKNTTELEIYGSKRYFCITGNLLAGHATEVAHLPDVFRAIAESVGASRKTADGDDRRAKSDESVKEKLGIDLKVARELLDHLPFKWCHEYGEWLRCGMALHHEFDGSIEALVLWEEFSKRSDKYTPGECGGVKWPTFGKRKPGEEVVTVRTLVREAEATGWRAPSTIASAIKDFDSRHTSELRLYNPLNDPPKRPRYLIGAPVYLPDEAEQAMFYGGSDTFKSTMVQGLCVYMAAGITLEGRAVAPRVVVYAAEEAPFLWDNNMHAWRLHFAKVLTPEVYARAVENLEAGYLQRIDGNVAGLNEARALQLAALAREQMRHLNSMARPVVVLDPIFEVMIGEENSSTDMRVYIAAGRAIQRELGALVVHVHHTGHSAGDRERGSSALPASQYVRYRLIRANRLASEVELRCVKHKAGAARTPSAWRVNMIELLPATDDSPEPAHGVVVEFIGDASPPQDAKANAEADDLVKLVQAYRADASIGSPRLRELLELTSDSKTKALIKRAVERGLLQAGGGKGRAGYSLTDAGRAMADAASGTDLHGDDDPLG
ncbi:AAA family ATPase [Rhizobacter fulvus]